MIAFSQIYDRFLSLCEPYRLSNTLADDAVADSVVVPADGPAVLAILTEEFSEDDLIAAGIVERVSDELLLSPTLRGGPLPLVALRSFPNEPAYALLTRRGLLSQDSLPVLVALDDHYTQLQMDEHGQRVYVAFSLEDFITLRGWGLPSTLANGLSSINFRQLQLLQRAYCWPAPEQLGMSALIDDVESAISEPYRYPTEAQIAEVPEQANSEPGSTPLLDEPVESSARAEDEDEEQQENEIDDEDVVVLADGNDDLVELILVDWSPTELTLDSPAEFAAVRSRFLDLAKHLEVDTSGVAVWRPSPDELESVQFCVDNGAIPHAVKAVRKSAQHSLFSLNSCPTTDVVVSGSTEIGPIINELEALLRAPVRDADAINEVILRHEEAINIALIAPLREQAFANKDPLKRSLILTAAELAKAFHRQAPFVGTSARTNGLGTSALGCDTEVFLKFAGQLRALYREWRR